MHLKLFVIGIILGLTCASALRIVNGTTATQKGSVAEGKKLFGSYCASCHGLDARGNGPVTVALKNKPPDLTQIEKKDGKFPADHLKAMISGETTLPVHGGREMPVWGGVLKISEINSLVMYLESIQRFPDLYKEP